MKNSMLFISRSLILLGMILLLNCSKDDDNGEQTSSTTTSSLSDQEKSDLLQLREEEKLARDVYLYTYDKYGLNVSINISNSEQTHMDQVLQILTDYSLEDPASSEDGVFNDEELQSLYDQLIEEVDVSVMEALIVGAKIEDLDIKDIEDFSQNSTKDDILNLYENLMCGSRNHLRSYYAQIISNGGSYEAAYISQSKLDSIIDSDSERCGQ